MTKPNVLFIMTDQQRFDTIAALGNDLIYTPNLDRLVRRGVAMTNAYSTCPVCCAARYTIRTGCEPPTTRVFTNGIVDPVPGQAPTMTGRCGDYLPQVMRSMGYRTFGIGKFHARPTYEDLGYNVHLHTEELWGDPESRQKDAYASYIAQREHYHFIEQLHGERTEMYYMPQTSLQAPEDTVEAFVADRAVHQIGVSDDKPYFGLVSFIGPHPPLAPPIPFNRIYHPERMPEAILGDLAVDHLDEQIPSMNHTIWADDVDDLRRRCCYARYYGEITYIDWCLGKILDAVEHRPDADNTLICFFTDHGEHLGDHHAWQKESYFEQSCHIPMLISWPARLPADVRRDELCCLTDLFAVATSAAGQLHQREGHDLLGVLEGKADARKHVIGYYGAPGTRAFKIMVRQGAWKYIYFANGRREQLFNLAEDPGEVVQRIDSSPEVAGQLRTVAIDALRGPAVSAALDGDKLRGFDFQAAPRKRINQFATDRGARGFPERPEDVLRQFGYAST